MWGASLTSCCSSACNQERHSTLVHININNFNYVVEGAHFSPASKINHSKHPNAKLEQLEGLDHIRLDLEEPYLHVVAIKQIDKGEEIFLDYGDGFFD